MKTGWIARYKDGTLIKEDRCSWANVDVSRIKDFSLFSHGKMFILPSDQLNYYQGKSACANLDGSGVEIISRYIGYENDSSKVQLRVDEKTGDCKLEIL